MTSQLCSRSGLEEKGAAAGSGRAGPGRVRLGRVGFSRVWSLWWRSADAVGDEFSGG